MSWQGFSDSVEPFMKKVLEKMVEMQKQEQNQLKEMFEMVKETKMVEWKNAYLQQSYKQLGEIITNTYQSNSFEAKDLREYLSTYSYSQFKASLQTWLKNGRTVWFVYGNVS